MPNLLLPPVPYTRTSVRPAWDDLSPALRSALAERLGAPVVEARVAGGGFTQGFAGLLRTADGASHFVKAAAHNTPIAEWYEREARLTAELPTDIPAARLRWAADLDGHFVLCLDAISDARVPELPWRPAELTAALAALAVCARGLASPSTQLLALELGSFGDVIDGTLDRWAQVAAVVNAEVSAEITAEVSAQVTAGINAEVDAERAPAKPHWPVDRLAELVELERRFDELSRDATDLIHCDLRLDNIVLDAAGKAWICDWSFLTRGPAWFDTVTLLLTAEASGLDADALFAAHPTCAGVPADALDAALAACAGYYVYQGAQPEVDGSPALRGHQRYYGQLAIGWLGRRQGWHS